MSVILVPPPPRVTLVDGSGRITRPWLLYLQDLFARSGSTVALSNDELQALTENISVIGQTAKALAWQALAEARKDIRAGDGVSVENDAQGVILSVIAEQLIPALIPYLPKPVPAPDVRPGSGVTVVKDAQGYVVSSLAGGAPDDMNNIIANRVYGG